MASEETFGPVAPIYKFDHEDEAIALANDTQYGLAAISIPMIFREPSVFMKPLTTGSSVSIPELSRPRSHPSVESRSPVSVARVGHTGSKSF